jgi:hypothetical protein
VVQELVEAGLDLDAGLTLHPDGRSFLGERLEQLQEGDE